MKTALRNFTLMLIGWVILYAFISRVVTDVRIKKIDSCIQAIR
jgi:hypothetical protein